jgi:hypothetical protein
MFFPETPMPISVLSAFLRLGKKYVIRQLFKEAERRLSFDSPLAQASSISAAGNVILFPRVSGVDPFNFMVMNLASEVGLLSTAVIAALYCCVACPALSIADGYDFDNIQCALSASNKRYCFLVQRYLAEVEKKLFQCLTSPSPACKYRSSPQSPCNSGFLTILRTIQLYPFTIWMDAWDGGLCVTCRTELRRKHEEARTMLWNNLPVDLGLGSWENIDKEAEIT